MTSPKLKTVETAPKSIRQIFHVERFNVLMKQVNTKRISAGGVIMPDQAVDDQKWTNGMGEIVAVGPAVYRGRKYEDVGIHPTDAPKVGDIVWFESRAPRRIKIDGEEHIVIPDDAIIARLDPEELSRFAFTIV